MITVDKLSWKTEITEYCLFSECDNPEKRVEIRVSAETPDGIYSDTRTLSSWDPIYQNELLKVIEDMKKATVNHFNITRGTTF